MSRMQLNEPIGVYNSLSVISCFVLGICRHELAFCGPDRVWMLAFYFIKSLSCRGIALFDHLVHSFIVEIIDGLFDVDVLLPAAAGGESGHQNSCAEPAKNGQRPHSRPRGGCRISLISQIACRIGKPCLAL